MASCRYLPKVRTSKYLDHYQDRCGANARIEAVIVIGVAEHTVKACTVDDGVNTGDTEGGGVAAVVAAVV